MKKPHYRPTTREIKSVVFNRGKVHKECRDELDDVDGFGRRFNWTPPVLPDYAAARPRTSSSNPVAMTDGVSTRYVGAQPNASTWGWESPGHYLAAVRLGSDPVQSNRQSRESRERLINAPTTYGSEGVGPDGGFAVPPDFRSAVMQKVTGEESLLARCDIVPTSGNGIITPKDESPPWASTGVQGYWTGEAAQFTQSKPILQKSTISTEKVTCLVPVTDELLEDAPALGKHVTSKGGEVIDSKVSDAIINGTGAGMPLGIMNSPVLVTVSKESSQVADTIHGLNLVKMWCRMPATWRSKAIWLVHPDAEPQLMAAGLQIKSPDGATVVGGSLVFLPANTVSNQPYATLFGRPVIPSQYCQALGDKGDIVFAAMQQYCALVKAPGILSDASIHLFFDYGITAFRFTLRMGGQPWWSEPLAAKNGSTTYSPFVTLEAR